MRHPILLTSAVLAGLLLIPASPASAKPPYLSELADYLGPHLRASLKDCATCHARPGETALNTELANPHNPFGARLMKAAAELAKRGEPAGIADRLRLIAPEDSDGDGVSNRQELLAGRQPGLAADRPSEAELAAISAPASPPGALRDHAWRPFKPVARPPLPPATKSGAWIRNPIDAFIAAEREKKGLKPRPEAPREVLLRRVYVDLTGLPPSRDELVAFLADSSPMAYERVVDRLLASPQYGERWARHWMDVWRYSDWDGYGAEVRTSHPHIWRWRDWIVNSLNRDRGYDQMVREMLAGDELAPGDPEVLPATGFLVRNWRRYSRDEMMVSTVESVGKAFLGLTLNCARCHDHKYDPVSQQEYYAFQAFFEPMDVRMDRVPGEADTTKAGLSRIYDGKPAAPTHLLIGGDVRKPDTSKVLAPQTPSFLNLSLQPLRSRPLPREEWAPHQRAWVVEEDLRLAHKAVDDAQRKLKELEADPTASKSAAARLAAARGSLAALQADIEVERLEAAGREASDACRDARREAMKARAEARLLTAEAAALESKQAAQAASAAAMAPGAKPAAAAAQKKAAEAVTAAAKELEAAHAEVEAASTAEYKPRTQPIYPQAATGRRTALARWITDPGNPLAARVAVNHIWLRHFGQPLVPTVFDFGGNGRPPAHPALLDWLAAELMGLPGGVTSAGRDSRDGYWSMKRIHRLMVTSAAYRMDSRGDAEMARKDPENRWYWRMNSRRMEAEAVRDSLLQAAGNLDLTAGGPEIDQGKALEVPRRSIYFRQSIEKSVPFLTVFDQASVAESYDRPITVVPQQALALSNSSLAISQARLLARRLWTLVERRPAVQAEEDFLSAAFQQVLGRLPSSQERVACREFLREQAARLASPDDLTSFTSGARPSVAASPDPAMRAREGLIHVLFNHNDFITLR